MAKNSEKNTTSNAGGYNSTRNVEGEKSCFKDSTQNSHTQGKNKGASNGMNDAKSKNSNNTNNGTNCK